MSFRFAYLVYCSFITFYRKTTCKNEEEPHISVDTNNSLHILHISKKEEGNYSCLLNGKTVQEFEVKVLSKATLLNQGQSFLLLLYFFIGFCNYLLMYATVKYHVHILELISCFRIYSLFNIFGVRTFFDNDVLLCRRMCCLASEIIFCWSLKSSQKGKLWTKCITMWTTEIVGMKLIFLFRLDIYRNNKYYVLIIAR